MTQPRSTLVSLDDGVGAPGHPQTTPGHPHCLNARRRRGCAHSGTPTLLERSAAPRSKPLRERWDTHFACAPGECWDTHLA